MLVLSRRQNEKILLPSIQASIEVLDIRGDRVRLGINAPADVTILREEVVKREGYVAPAAEAKAPLPAPVDHTAEEELRRQRHQLRNQLNFASVGLALAKRQLQAGRIEDLEDTLAKVAGGFEQLNDSVITADAQRPAAKQPRALLVEDDSNECELLAGFFRLAGYQVITAHDGRDALDYLDANETPDVMLLDMILPRCDGPTTIRMVRENPALGGMKIFAVSGCTPDQLGLDFAAVGVERWFQKPLNPESLLRELSASCNVGSAV